MTDTWGPTTQTAGADQPVTVMLAARISEIRTTTWQQSIQMDNRFRLVAAANDSKDMQAKLANNPEVILLDATIFDPPGLLSALTSMTAAVYVVLPVSITQMEDPKMRALPETLRGPQFPAVKQVIVGDPNIAELLARAYADALALRKTISAPASAFARSGAGGGAVVSGMRIITVWNRAGGVGRTTIAAALAQAVARKGIRSLLIGLDAPDVIPLHLGLNSEPNVLNWFANPTAAGLTSATQSLGDLDVIAGFPDTLSESEGDVPDDSKNSIREMVMTASYAGYAGIILDTPSGGVVSHAIAAANTWVLVARPTVADAWASVDAFRTVTQRAAGQHRINPGNVFVVLNMRGQGMMNPNEWHQAADAASRKLGLQLGFPPVAAVIPFIPNLPLAQDSGRPALDIASDEFARPIHQLADSLFGGQTVTGQPQSSGKKPFLSIKVKR